MTTLTPKPAPAARAELDPSKTRPLAHSIPKNGFVYEQVLRDEHYAIYKQRLKAESSQGLPVRGCLAYEVWRIQVEAEQVIMGKVVPQRERGPSDSQFGTFGWSYPSLERAKAKMRDLREAREAGVSTSEAAVATSSPSE